MIGMILWQNPDTAGPKCARSQTVAPDQFHRVFLRVPDTFAGLNIPATSIE